MTMSVSRETTAVMRTMTEISYSALQRKGWSMSRGRGTLPPSGLAVGRNRPHVASGQGVCAIPGGPREQAKR